MVLTFRVVQRRAFGDGRLIKHAGEVHALRLPVRQGVAHVHTIAAPRHSRDEPKPELGHDRTNTSREQEEYVASISGRAVTAPTYPWIQRRTTTRRDSRSHLRHP